MPASAWAIFILVLCTSSNGGFVPHNFIGVHTDKWGHAFIFSVQVYFLMLGFIKMWRYSFLINKIRLISVLIAAVFAIAIELIQHYFTTDRMGDYLDVIADFVGILCGLIMFHTVYGNLKFLDREEKTQ